MRRFVSICVVVLALVAYAASAASADPTGSTQAVIFHATCTGLGAVTLVNTGPAHTEALQVVGRNTVVLVPFNGAPGIIAAGTAAGTSCTFADGPSGFPATMPVIIING